VYWVYLVWDKVQRYAVECGMNLNVLSQEMNSWATVSFSRNILFSGCGHNAAHCAMHVFQSL